MKDNKLTWCGVEVTEEEYERLAQEYLRQFAEAEFVPEAEETEAVLVVKAIGIGDGGRYARIRLRTKEDT